MIPRIFFVALLLFGSLALGAATLAASPFPTRDSAPGSTPPAPDGPFPSPAAPGVRDARAEPPGLVTRYLLELRRIQASLHRELAERSSGVATTGSPAAFASLMIAGFVYGVFHAAGPGHGKVVITSYLFANVSRIRRGLLLSAAASAAQAATAILLVGIAALLLGFGHFQTVAAVWYLEMASYLLLVLVGLLLLRRVARGDGCGHAHHGHGAACGHHHHGHDHAHGHHHHLDHAHPPHEEPGGGRGFLSMVAAVGIRPCSGAVILLLFSLAQGIFLAGVAGTLAMAVGTALTVSVLAILSVSARRFSLRLAGDGVWFGRIHTLLAGFGAVAITLLGLSMFAAGLAGGAQPF